MTTRAWGDVISVELKSAGSVFFSFQVAERSAQLEAPLLSPLPGKVLIDSLPDLVAS